MPTLTRVPPSVRSKPENLSRSKSVEASKTKLGTAAFVRLVRHAVDSGISFFDCADAYGSHPFMRAALAEIPRERVQIKTKIIHRTASEATTDLDRFRRELGTDYLDIVLMHCVTEGNWTEQYKGAMDVLSEAKQKGIIRSHGCSCHSIEALGAAAKSPWVEVDLVRINPIGSHMDADPGSVVSVIRQMKAAGKGIIGMKILGQGDLRNRQSEAIKYALSLNLLDAFSIGAESKSEQDNLIQRVAAA